VIVVELKNVVEVVKDVQAPDENPPPLDGQVSDKLPAVLSMHRNVLPLPPAM
jgi:hypothetical protein